jgi:hypothetical protein
MTKIEVFNEDHLARIEPKDIFDTEIKQLILKFYKHQEVYSYVHEETGEVLCIFGATVLFKGVAEFWTVVTKKDILSKHQVEFVKLMRVMIDKYAALNDMKRVQITVPSRTVNGKKWGEVLGFELEAVMKNYGWDNSDHYLFARYYGD